MKWVSRRRSLHHPTMEDYFNRKMKLNQKNHNKMLTISRKDKKVSDNGSEEDGGNRVVVVGVKLDSKSKEMLTWALVKVANPGDQVIALHILENSEALNAEGNSSLLSLVKASDSLLAVYEGFCNLKQVDLKLKICRGSSVRKVLVREAKAYFASKVIVGTSRKHHGIGLLSTSNARYCARKLSKECWVLAVNNGKVVFEREASRVPRQSNGSRGVNESNVSEHRRRSFLRSIHWKSIKNPKLCNPKSTQEISSHCPAEHSLDDNSSCSETSQQQKCPICSSVSVLLHSHCTNPTEETLSEDNSLALVPLQTPETTPRSVSLCIQDLPELRRGWSLHQDLPSNQQIARRSSVKEASVVQWAMWLPSRYCSTAVYPVQQVATGEKQKDHISDLDGESGAIVPVGDNPNSLDSADYELEELVKENQTSNLDGETGAIVLVGNNYNSPPASPDHKSKDIPKELESLHEKYSSTCRLFGYTELVSATSDFSHENLIGSGGSSYVYRGCLPDGKELAVKILKPSEDVLNEFAMEVEIITTLNHKNIVSLFGFCFEDSNLLLVYDFLSRGSLEENLHGNKDKTMFGWGERYKVALGVAEALEYLHNGSAQSVIHRDVKSSNILLSDDFEPQLSDFGLAKWASTSTVHVTCSNVAGTFGYLAPEYFMFGKLNDKVDVYAFGVVLLELLSGRKPIDNEYPKGQESLVMWAKPILNGGKVRQLLDPRFGDNYDHDQIERMVLAATLCIRRSPRARPGMKLVLKLLQGDDETMKWARLEVSASEDFDGLDDESVPSPSFQSHLNLALCDFEDDSSLSFSSVEQNVSVEDYLKGRWSRSSSFD